MITWKWTLNTLNIQVRGQKKQIYTPAWMQLGEKIIIVIYFHIYTHFEYIK